MDVDIQERCVAALGFTRAHLDAAREAIERGDTQLQVRQQIAQMMGGAPAPVEHVPIDRNPLVFPLDGTVRAGAHGLTVHDAGDLQTYDMSNYLNDETRILDIVGESMYPILEGGQKATYSLKGYPKRNHLAVIRFHDGSYLVKKFIRMTDAIVDCIEMESVDLPDGRTAYVEKPVSYPLQLVKAVYPSWIRMD
jgi:hypothetical protein